MTSVLGLFPNGFPSPQARLSMVHQEMHPSKRGGNVAYSEPSLLTLMVASMFTVIAHLTSSLTTFLSYQTTICSYVTVNPCK